MVQRFEDQDGGTVTHHETLAVLVERKGGVLGIGRTGERLRIGESGHADRDGGVLGTAGDDRVGISVPNSPEGLTQAVGRGGAGRDDIQARALGLMADGHMTGGDVGNHRRDEQRRDPLAGGIFHHFRGFAELDLESADPGAHIHAQAERIDIGVLPFGLQTGLVHGLDGGGDGELGEFILLADKSLVHPVSFGVEILHFTGNGDGHVLEIVHEVDSAHPVHQVLPIGVHIVADGRNDTHSSDNYSFRFHNLSTTVCKYTNYSSITTRGGRPPT